MSEETEDNKDNEGNRVSINYRISKEAKQALINYADKFSIRPWMALDHILLCINRNNNAIEQPSKIPVKFELGNDGNVITIASCLTCKDSFSPAVYGESVEALMQWVEKHKHSKG